MAALSRSASALLAILILVTGISVILNRVAVSPESRPSRFPKYNLTEQGVKWKVQGLRPNLDPIETELILPMDILEANSLAPSSQLSFSTRISLNNELMKFREHLVIYFGNIVSRGFEIYLNGEPLADSSMVSNRQAIAFGYHLKPEENEFDLRIDLKSEGLSAPGFDVRSNVIIGHRYDMDRLSLRKQRQEIEISMWLFLPQLMVGFLFAIGAVVHKQDWQYLIFSIFTSLSALRSSLTLGLFQLPFTQNVDNWLVVNILELLTQGTLVVFTLAFFRRPNRRIYLAAAITACICIAAILYSSFSDAGDPQVNFILGKLVRLVQLASLGFLAYWGISNYLKLRSHPAFINSRRVRAALGAVALVSVPFYLYFLLNSQAYWLISPVFHGLFTMLMSLCVVTELAGTQAQRDKFRQKMAMMVGEAKVNSIVYGSEKSPEKRRDVTILFIDIRGFTSLSQVESADAVLEAVNQYYNIVTKCVNEHGGLVDKFIGDGVLAVWGVEGRLNDSALNAVRAAKDISNHITAWNTERREGNLFPIRIGIGLHTGDVIYGLVGSGDRAEHTVLGSVVNTTARIESYTKNLGVEILMSSKTWAQVKHYVAVNEHGLLPFNAALVHLDLYELVEIYSEPRERPVVYPKFHPLSDAV